jgi:hypothetical protein
MEHPMDSARAKMAISDSELQASLLLAVGSLVWKWVSVAANIDFLLQINEEKFAMIFDFIENMGWIFLVIIAFIWGAIRLSRSEKASIAPSWSTVIVISIFSFMFGTLIAVRSTGHVPDLIGTWGSNPSGCTESVYTNKLLSFRTNYKLAVACGLDDATVDKLDDDAISISNAFTIIPGAIDIFTPMRDAMLNKLKAQQLGRTWHIPVLVPNGIQTNKITTLSELQRMGGKLLVPQYFN